MIRQQVFTLLEVSFQVAYIHLITNDLSNIETNIAYFKLPP